MLRAHLRQLGLAAGLLATLLAGGCATTGVNRGDFNLISLQEEWQLGQRLEADLARRLPIVQDRAAQAYVDAIGQRLVRQTELAQLPWEFHLVDSPEINAFNIPGGHVYVNTGLIRNVDDVAEFTGVLAHEIAHGVARHGTEQLSRAYGLSAVAGAVLGQNPQVYEQILAQILGRGALARFSRSAENEADALGVRTMYEAGYDPRGMLEVFERLLAQRRRRPSSVEQFFASHPLTEERLANVRQQIAGLPRREGLVSRDPDYQRLQQRVSG